MNAYDEFVARKQREYGDKFDPSDLAEKFVHFFDYGQRIEVKTPYGEVERGRVGVTTGWKPSFLLVHRRSDHGSSTLLSDKYEVTRIVSK